MKKALFLGVLLAVAAAIVVASSTARVTPAAKAASPLSADRTLVKCSKTMTVGFLYPKTGPAASLGKAQFDWANFYRQTKKGGRKIKLQAEDTQLGGTQSPAEAVRGAQAVVGSNNILGIVGPAGSQEVVATTPVFKDAGLAFVSGSATRTTLTDGSRRGFFYRVVPPDAQQSTDVVNFMTKKLKVKRVFIIDEQNAYSQGLADEVQTKLRA